MAKAAPRKAMEGKPTKVKLTKTGQHVPCGDGCFATSANGKPCPRPRAEKGIPYCKECMKTGDPSLKAVKHPKYGQTLIATRNLKKGYYAAWWGHLVAQSKLPDWKEEWALLTPKGYIDALPFKGSQLKWCSCPGPGEVSTINFSSNYDRFLKKSKKACLLFALLRDVPKNNQVTMMYNEDEKTTDEFFAERNIVRADVGCKQYPAAKKARNHPYWDSAKYKATLKVKK